MHVYIDFSEHNLRPLATRIFVFPPIPSRPRSRQHQRATSVSATKTTSIPSDGATYPASRQRPWELRFVLPDKCDPWWTWFTECTWQCVCVFNCWKEIIVYTYFILFHRMFYGLAMGILRWTEVVPEQRTTKVEALLVAYWSYQPHRYKRLLYHRRLKPFVVFIIPLSCEALKSMCIDLVCVLDVCVGEPISPRIEATPLICCMLGRSFHAAAVLIAAGADVHLTNYEGQECKLNQLRKILQKLVVSWNLAESLELT